MKTRMIEAKVLLGEGEVTLDKTLVIDFTKIGDENGIFMVESVNEWFELETSCVSCNDTVTVSGWVYKNICYKNVNSGDVGIDSNGNPFVYGEIRHYTTRIPVQECIKIDRERGEIHLNKCEDACEHLCKEDKVEVCAKVGSCSENLLEPITPSLTEEYPQVYPKIYNHSKLKEVMCIKITAKVYRWEEFKVPFEPEC